MDYDEKQSKLSQYILRMRTLEGKINDLNNWSSMKSGSVIAKRNNLGCSGIDYIVNMTDTIQQDIEDSAKVVDELRRELTVAITLIPDEGVRNIITDRYIAALGKEEIAKKYNYTKRTINRKLYAAIDMLEKYSNYFNN